MGKGILYSSLCQLSTCHSDPSIAKQLVDKIYERRKAAALDLEKYADRCDIYVHLVFKSLSNALYLTDLFANAINRATNGALGRLLINSATCSLASPMLFTSVTGD